MDTVYMDGAAEFWSEADRVFACFAILLCVLGGFVYWLGYNVIYLDDISILERELRLSGVNSVEIPDIGIATYSIASPTKGVRKGLGQIPMCGFFRLRYSHARTLPCMHSHAKPTVVMVV